MPADGLRLHLRAAVAKVSVTCEQAHPARLNSGPPPLCWGPAQCSSIHPDPWDPAQGFPGSGLTKNLRVVDPASQNHAPPGQGSF